MNEEDPLRFRAHARSRYARYRRALDRPAAVRPRSHHHAPSTANNRCTLYNHSVLCFPNGSAELFKLVTEWI